MEPTPDTTMADALPPPDPAIVASPVDRPRRRRTTHHRRLLWRRLRWWLVGLAVLVIALLAVSAVRYYSAVEALLNGRSEVVSAQHLLTGDLSHLDHARLEQASADLRAAEDDFGARSEILGDGWLAGIATHVPGISANVEGARRLRTAGEDGTRLGLDVIGLVEQVIPSSTPAGATTPFERLVQLASNDRPQLDRTTADLAVFEKSLAAVPGGKLLGPLSRARATLLSEGHQVTGVAGPAINLLEALPAAIGPGQHTYLVLLENPGEERPGGGFIGAVGTVTFSDGAVTGLAFHPFDYFTPLVTDIPAPAPLNEYLFHGVPLDLGDANWSPDFPTSAAEVELFYTQATGQTVDGTIDVDPVAVSYLLQVLGPMQAAPYPQTITAGNVLMELNYLVNLPGDPGKPYLAAFGSALVNDLINAPVDQMPALASALERGANQKHIVLYFHNASLEALADGAGYGGQLGAPLSDSLLIDDANLSGTKGDLFVTRSFSLTATVESNGNVQDHLVLQYHNPIPPTADDRLLEPGSGGDYRDYLRVYIPETAQLGNMSLSIDGRAAQQVAPGAVTWELSREAIGFWLIVPYGGSATLTLDYSGPFANISVTPEHYALVWEKQINALTWPVTVTVTMPDGRSYHWSSSLVTDRSWSVEG
jgi:hypothetical protein